MLIAIFSTALFLLVLVLNAAADSASTLLRGAERKLNANDINIRGLADFEWSVLPVEGFPTVAFNGDTTGGEVDFRYNYTGILGVVGSSYSKYLSFVALPSDCDTNSPVDPSIMSIQESNGQDTKRIVSGINNEIELTLDINQATISSSSYYTPAPDGLSAEIVLCMRASYMYDTDNDPSTPDSGVGFHETVLTISVDLTAGFALTGINVEREAADDANANLECEVEAYYCNDAREAIQPRTLAQGDMLQFCVEVTPESAEQYYIRDIMETDLEQDNNDNDVYREEEDEWANIIVNYQSDFLTIKSCISGICQVKTQLMSKYFTGLFPRSLDVYGVALCALGSVPTGETGITIPTGGGSETLGTLFPAATSVPIGGEATTTNPTGGVSETLEPPATPAPSEECIPSATNCCSDSDCTNPFGAICDRETGTCACDATKCERMVNVGADKICMSDCDCPQDCNSGTGTCNGTPELTCATCDGTNECIDGYTCDGKYCVPAGRCTARKQTQCDNAYFEITGRRDQLAKCCPDSSGCVKNILNLGWNSVCSTTCGMSCMGQIQGGGNNNDDDYPKILCAAAPTALADFLSLEMCYEDIVKPYCEDVTPILDTGTQKCKDFHSGENAGCVAPLYTVCCAPGFENQLTCDANFIVPDELPQ